jgi:hypothetical protein
MGETPKIALAPQPTIFCTSLRYVNYLLNLERINWLSRTSLRFCNLPSYPTRFYIRRSSPSSLEQVWTPDCTPDKFPFISSHLWERSRNHRHNTKTNIVVTIRARVPIAISRTAIPGIVVPRTATQQLKVPIPSSNSQLNEKFD